MSDTTNTATAAEVRKWAQENGISVGKRGRLHADVKRQFTEATGRDVR